MPAEACYAAPAELTNEGVGELRQRLASHIEDRDRFLSFALRHHQRAAGVGKQDHARQVIARRDGVLFELHPDRAAYVEPVRVRPWQAVLGGRVGVPPQMPT